jgi:hypothetical protein
MHAIYRTLCFPPVAPHGFEVFLVLALLTLWNLVVLALVLANWRWPSRLEDQRREAARLKRETRCKHRRSRRRRDWSRQGPPRRRHEGLSSEHDET